MFIAENDFIGEKIPSKDLDNWDEFEKAPRGEKGRDGREMAPRVIKVKRAQRGCRYEWHKRVKRGIKAKRGQRWYKGEKGDKGDAGKQGMKGDKGDAGTGLNLKKFNIGQSYKKGDYVFAKATHGHHNSMFIAENDFICRKNTIERLGQLGRVPCSPWRKRKCRRRWREG